MRTWITIFLVAIGLSVCGQSLNSDSVLFQNNLYRFVNKKFSILTTNSVLNQMESKYGSSLNSLGECFVVFANAELGEEEEESMIFRIQEIAKLFFYEGTPIYLSIGGSQSAGCVANQNNKDNKGNLTFVSFGNYCVVGKLENEFETIFNKRTLELLKMESIE